MTHKSSLAIVSYFLFLLSIGGIAVAYVYPIDDSLKYIVILVSGMSVMGAFDYLNRYVRDQRENVTVIVQFNEREALRNIQETQPIDGEFKDVTGVVSATEENISREQRDEYELILLEDSSLALAKLRMDIERQLRSLYQELGLAREQRILSIKQLLQTLQEHKALPFGLATAINDVLPACNQAIHGGKIEMGTARSILAVGMKIIGSLEQLAERKAG